MKNIKLLGSAMLVSLALFSQSSLAKEYKIGASLLTQQHPFYIDLANAMKEEAKKDNVNLSVSIANQDLNKQLSDVEDFITKKVDAIIVSPVDSKGVQAAIIKADKAGIPVITVDVAAEGVPVVSHVATDNYAGGVEAGKLMGKLLHGKGTVAIISYPALQSVVARVDGFKKGLSDTPDIKIVAEQPGRAPDNNVAEVAGLRAGLVSAILIGDDDQFNVEQILHQRSAPASLTAGVVRQLAVNFNLDGRAVHVDEIVQVTGHLVVRDAGGIVGFFCQRRQSAQKHGQRQHQGEESGQFAHLQDSPFRI